MFVPSLRVEDAGASEDRQQRADARWSSGRRRRTRTPDVDAERVLARRRCRWRARSEIAQPVTARRTRAAHDDVRVELEAGEEDRGKTSRISARKSTMSSTSRHPSTSGPRRMPSPISMTTPGRREPPRGEVGDERAEAGDREDEPSVREGLGFHRRSAGPAVTGRWTDAPSTDRRSGGGDQESQIGPNAGMPQRSSVVDKSVRVVGLCADDHRPAAPVVTPDSRPP